MSVILRKLLLCATFASAFGACHAAPAVLDDEMLDQISAGAQYSLVEGGAAADYGTVTIKSWTSAATRPSGTSVTKARLVVRAVGTGVAAYGYGESGANGQVDAAYGYGEVGHGAVTIRVKTVSRVQSDGDVIVRTRVNVKTVEHAARASAHGHRRF